VRQEDDGRIALGGEVDLGELPDSLGTIYHAGQCGVIVISWASSQVRVYGLEGGTIALKKTLDIPNIVDIKIVGGDLIAVSTDVRNIALQPFTSGNSPIGAMSIFQPFSATETNRNQQFLQWDL
jgi:hypothetical protein